MFASNAGYKGQHKSVARESHSLEATRESHALEAARGSRVFASKARGSRTLPGKAMRWKLQGKASTSVEGFR